MLGKESMSDFSHVIDPLIIAELRERLEGRLIALCFGAGVDSTAMMVALKVAGITPSVITFADLKSEKSATYAHLAKMQEVMKDWGWPEISVVSKETLDSTEYNDLYGNCTSNQTLPSLAFGMKSCSLKWKAMPQDNFLMGVKRGPNKKDSHPVWDEAKSSGMKIIKLIGYDCGKADMRRSKNIPAEDANFEYYYPLQIVGWKRQECVQAIIDVLGENYVPVKSACFFCPASKEWELYWLAAYEPDLLEKALYMERVALTGRHSRFDTLIVGKSWEEMITSGERFPSSSTTVGLGRSFAWNQWAYDNQVVDEEFNVLRTPEKQLEFISKSGQLQKSDNALDVRGKKVINIVEVEALQSPARAYQPGKQLSLYEDLALS